MSIETWPNKNTFGSTSTEVTRAEVLDKSQERYRVVFHDSSGNQLTVVPITDTALRALVQTGMKVLGLASKA